MQAASQLATAHYPETLDRIFIIGAPYFFSTVWGWVKRWFDPITVSKIFILGPHEVKSTLEEFIDPKNIPKQYGGELDFTWGDQPKTDPYIKEQVKWENGLTDFPEGPKYWRPTADGERMECVAVGSEGGKQRMVSVGTLERICNVKKQQEAVNGDALVEGVKGLSVADEKKEVVETGEEAKVPAVTA